MILRMIGTWMPVDDPVFSGDQVRHDRQKKHYIKRKEALWPEYVPLAVIYRAIALTGG